MSELSEAPGAANVTIELDGKEFVLKPTPECAIRLCRAPGGLTSTMDGANTLYSRVSACDMDAMSEVIRAGLGVGSQADPKLGEKIYRSGIFTIRASLQVFVAIIGNGGRPLVAAKPDEDEDGGAAEGDDPLAPKSPPSTIT